SHAVNTASFHIQVWCNPHDPWMTVNAGGAVIAHGRASATGSHLGTGMYDVLFDRAVDKCGYPATIANADFTFWAGPLIEVNSVRGNHRMIQVTVRHADGTYLDMPFHVVATCGQKKIWAVLPSPVTSGIARGGHLVKAGTVKKGVMSAQF